MVHDPCGVRLGEDEELSEAAATVNRGVSEHPFRRLKVANPISWGKDFFDSELDDSDSSQ
jgi:hypothetical protein